MFLNYAELSSGGGGKRKPEPHHIGISSISSVGPPIRFDSDSDSNSHSLFARTLILDIVVESLGVVSPLFTISADKKKQIICISKNKTRICGLPSGVMVARPSLWSLRGFMQKLISIIRLPNSVRFICFVYRPSLCPPSGWGSGFGTPIGLSLEYDSIPNPPSPSPEPWVS